MGFRSRARPLPSRYPSAGPCGVVPEKGPDSEVWPLHETLVELLRRLNRMSEHVESVDGMELREIERSMYHFWVTRTHEVDLHRALALGLLLRNGLVQVMAPGDYSWQRQRSTRHGYQITAEGKKFLVSAIETSDRIS